MGYGSWGNFVWIEQLLAGAPARSGTVPRICELGDQTIQVTDEAAAAMLDFARRHGAAADTEALSSKLQACAGRALHVCDVFRAAGFDYVSIDVNEAGGARFADLNYWPNETAGLGRFDIVTNFGTTEHIANQACAFATVHHLLAPGGAAIHHVPMVHHLNHAMVNLTPRFLIGLASLNDYAIEAAIVQPHCLDEAIEFHYGPDILYCEGMRPMLRESTLAAMVFVVLRKRSDAPFIPPIDVGPDLARYRRLLEHGLVHYNPGIGAAEMDAAIAAAIRRTQTQSHLAPIQGNIETRPYERRLGRTGGETGDPESATASRDPMRPAGRACAHSRLIQRARAFLAPTVLGKLKRRWLDVR